MLWDEECSAVDENGVPYESEADWNSFAPATWSDPSDAPYRTADALFSGWKLKGLEDAQATTIDTAFAGGTKQDDNCAFIKGGKAPNKDDLKRVYISSKTVNGRVILNLAWVRIPQNTTSPSAHIGFEFNQAKMNCTDPRSEGLVEREEGDMLIVYDFTGGATDTPTITLRRWVTALGAACEVGSSSAPCWGPSINLTTLTDDDGFPVAEARVNTLAEVFSEIAPDLNPSESDMLGLNEFGEAGIDLTAAGVFDENTCLAFGNAFAVSRSSGNSAKAQMKDLVGPGPVNISNCGRVIIRKETTPDGSDTSFNFTTTGDPLSLSPASFALKDGESQDYGATVPVGDYSVTETVPSGWDLDSIDCSDTTSESAITSISGATATFSVQPDDVIDCTYNNEAKGDITVTKEVVNACGDDDGQFTLFIDGPVSGDSDKSTKTGGDGTTLTALDLAAGTYAVGENAPGDNYSSSIGGDADCNDGSVNLDAGESVSCTVTNTRRPTVTIVKSVADGSTWDLLIDDGGDGFDDEAVNKGDKGSLGPITITTFDSDTGLFGPVVLGEEATDGADGDTKALSGIGTYKAYWRCNNSIGDTEKDHGDDSDPDRFTIDDLRPGETVTCTVTNIPVAAGACETGS